MNRGEKNPHIHSEEIMMLFSDTAQKKTSPLKLLPGEIHLWQVSFREMEAAFDAYDYRFFLKDDEQQRFCRYLFPEHKKRFLFGRIFLRQVLSKYGNFSCSDLVFGRGKHGKPFIVCPEEAASVRFSLSHTKDLFLCAVTTRAFVGVDGEYIKNDPAAAVKLAKRFFPPEEAACLEKLDDKDKVFLFYAFWTLREAFVKAEGKSLFSHADAVVFHGSKPPGQKILITCTTLEEKNAHFFLLWPGIAHVASVCVLDSCASPCRIVLKKFSLDRLDGKTQKIPLMQISGTGENQQKKNI